MWEGILSQHEKPVVDTEMVALESEESTVGPSRGTSYDLDYTPRSVDAIPQTSPESQQPHQWQQLDPKLKFQFTPPHHANVSHCVHFADDWE